MTALDSIARAFGQKPLLLDAARLDAGYGQRRPYALQGGVAIIDISGVLTNGATLFEQVYFGVTDYTQVLDEIEQALADPDVGGILLRINSPGGDSDNAFETADAIARAAGQKPIWAVADTSMFSAAYLLASGADRIYVPRYTGGVGSIGVYAQHFDWSEYNRKLGLNVTYISEGEGKTDGNPDEPLSDAARSTLEADVARLYGLFVAAVANRRKLPEARVRQLGAALVYGSAAVEAGLADYVGSSRDALAALALYLKQHSSAADQVLSIPKKGNTNMDGQRLAAEATPAAAEVDLDAVRAEARTQGHAQGYADAREIVELCALAGMPGRAAALLAKSATPAEARQHLIDARAAEDATEIRSHVMPDAGTAASMKPEDSPVVKAVERLAGKGVN